MNCISLLFIIIFGLSVNAQAEIPQISQISPQETREDIAVSIPFTVTADSEIVSVSLESSNQSLIPNDYLLYECDAKHYTMVATPNNNQTGAATITIAVTTLENDTQTTSFVLTVTDFDDSMYFWKNHQTAAAGIENIFTYPAAVAVDPMTGKLFVSDTGNNRVLRFSKEDTTISEAVFGDAGSYTMDEPMGIHVDPFGRLWVSDMKNHRILRYDHASTKPTRAPPDGILGKSNPLDYSRVSQDTMNCPTDVWLDPTGTLWVADSENHRILRFDNAAQKENYANADAVLGQPNFSSLIYGVSQSKFHTPRAIVVYQRHLFVADFSNNRVLCFKNAASKSFLADADLVLGQPDFVSKARNLSATGMDLPSGLAIDTDGRLYVAEQNNNRVLIFDNVINKSNGDAANNLLGQANFLSNRIDSSYQSLFAPYILNYDAFNNHLWVPDLIHNRVLRFDLNLKQPPSLGIVDNQTIKENAISNPLTFTVTDNNDQSLTITYDYSNKNLLSSDSFAFNGPQVISDDDNITINATSADTPLNLVLTPAFEKFGSTTVTITVTDPHGMQDTRSFTLNVLEVNDPPTITTIDNQTIIEDTESTPIHFTVADIEGNQLHIEVYDDGSGLFPSNADNITLSNESGGITWQLTTDKDSDLLTLLLRPALNKFGSSMLTVTVNDGENLVHTNFTMTVSPQNDRPAISTIVNQTTDEDTQSQAIPFTVFDPDASRLTITVESGNHTLISPDPQHITLAHASGNSSYTLTTHSGNEPLTLYVLPSKNLSGAVQITITATDGELSHSQSFSMTVAPVNDLPIISEIQDQSTVEDIPITGIGFSVNDIDTNILSIEIVSNSPDIIPSDPAHITLQNAIGESGYTLLANPFDNLTLALKPLQNVIGIAEIIVKVTGGTTYATTAFTVTVTPVNDAPVFSKISDQYALEDTLAIIPFIVTDPDTDPLTLTIATGNDLLIPSNASNLTLQTVHGQFSNTLLTIPGGEAISLTVLPLLNQSGKTNITITATDGIAQVSTSFTISISGVNDAPMLSIIKNQTVLEDTESSPIAFTVSDAENDALTITVVSINKDLIPSDSNHITLSNAAGEHSYTLTTHAGDQLHLTLLSSHNLFGPAIISITVTDGTLFSSRSFTMTVIPVNDAPIISSIANISIPEDTASPQIIFSATDPESDQITIEIQSNNQDLIATHTSHITLQGMTGGSSYTLATHPGPLTLTLLPNANQTGSAEIIIHATDGKDRSVYSFIMTVTEVNDAPIISLIPNQATTEDTPGPAISFRITDVDASQLSIYIQSGNENLLPLDANHITLCNASGGNTYTLLTNEKIENLTLTVLPGANQIGDVSITVLVSDTYTIVSQSFTLAITPVNDAPVIVPVPEQSANEDQPNIKIPFTAYDFEDPACSLAITLISSNQTLLPNEYMTYSCYENMYTIVANPSLNQNGSLEITIIATDLVGKSTTSTFGLNLVSINDPPTIHAPTRVRVKMNFSTPISGIYIDDCDAGTSLLAITLVTDEGTISMPAQQGGSIAFTGTLADINSELSTITYSPTYNALGSRAITITVNDMGHSGEGGNQIKSRSVLLQIHDDNVRPVNYLPSLTMNEDESIQVTPISVFDLDAANNAIEVTLTTKHASLTFGETEPITLIAGNYISSTQVVISGSQYDINRALAHLSLTCTTHFNGWAAHTMTTNDLGHTGESYSPQTATDSVSITVLATIDPPTHLVPESISLIEDISTAFTLCVVDPDGEDIISVDLAVTTGALQLNSGKGLTGYLGTGNYLSFTGKKSDVNYAMQGIVFKPTANVAGNFLLTMTYKDVDFAAQSISIPLRISAVNDPPTIHMKTSSMTINEDTPLTLTISVFDIEAGINDIQVNLTSSYSLLKINQTGLTVYPSNIAESLTMTGSINSINSALSTLNVTPTPNYYGNSFITIKVDDLGYLPLPAESTQKTISITILPVNDPPDFNLAPNIINVLEDFSDPQIITFTKSPSIFGEPTQVTYTLTPEPETISWVAITFSPESGRITITAIENRHGAATFRVTANDGADENNIASKQFSLTVAAVNDPPEFVLDRNQIAVNEDFATIESITLTPAVIPSDEPKTITYVVQPASLTWVNHSINSETGQITITSIPNGYGEKLISVIADDGDITVTHTFTITVASINDLPHITSSNHFSISENTSIGTMVHRLAAIDVDHQNLIYTINSIVPAASFAISQNTGEIWIKDNLDHETINTYTMTVSVSDPMTSVNQTIVATITDLNDAPNLLNTPEQTLTTFQNESFHILGMHVRDIDAGSFPIQLTFLATNGAVSITHTSLTLESGNYSTTSLSVSGTITAINQALTKVWFNPKPDYKGPANILVKIDDLGHTGPGSAQSDSELITIYILNYNAPPVFTQYASQGICYEDQSFSQTIVISDEDAIDEPIQLTLISEHGSLTLSNIMPLNKVYYSKYMQSYTGSISEMNTALNELIFTPEMEFSGTAGYTLYANDLGHSGIGGPKCASPAMIRITCIAVNDPPMHSLPALITGLEETDIPVTITVSDVDAYTHAIHIQLEAFQGGLSLSSLNGLTLSNNDGIAETSLSFTGTIDAINNAMHPLLFHPTTHFYGQAGLTITSNDLGFSVPQGNADPNIETDSLTITVINVNDPPNFVSLPLQSIDEDSVYSYTIQAGDVDFEHVSLTALSLPDWLTFSDYGNNTGILQGIPHNAHVGISAPLTIVATDPNQAKSIQTFSIVVNNTNDEPSFHSSPIEQAIEDSVYQYTVTAFDIDKDASLSFRGIELPDWLKLFDYGDGTALLTGKPENDDVGAINVVIISVTDGISVPIKQAFMIDVINTNDPPEIISTPVFTATEDALYNYSIAAYDMDGDSVSFIATALPDWLYLTNIGGNKAIIQGTPENEHVGQSERLIITAKDSFDAGATQSFVITVINTNDPPAFSSLPLIEATEDSLYAYTITVQDIDIGASIDMWTTILSGWLTFIDNGDGTALLSGIPRNAHVGIKNAAVIKASDGIDDAIEQSFMITVVNTNDPPEIVSTPVFTATEDSFYSCTIVAEDMDGDLLDFTSAALPQWLSLINNHNNTATLQGVPDNDDVGLSRPLTIIAKDPDNVTATQTFSITVQNTNDKPVFISQAKTSAIEDSLYDYTITVQDVDIGASITIKAASLPHWLSFTDFGNGTAIITGIPLNDDVHNDNIVVLTANDGIATAVSQAFLITVINTNDAPVISSQAVLTATEDAPYVYTIIAEDMDGDILAFKSELPSWLSLIDHGNNTASLTGIPTNNDVGLSNTLTITTMDSSKASASQYFEILVINTNDAPVFISLPQETAIEDHTYNYTVTVLDVDRDASIQMGALNLPDWLTIVDNGNGTANITGMPLNEHVGTGNPLVITATDGIASEITQIFAITVTNTNDIPEITSDAFLTATEDFFYAYTVTGRDIDGDLLFFKAHMPSWLTLVNHNNNTATIKGRPSNDDVGISPPIILTASDPDNATATQTFEIVIINTNDAPTFETRPIISTLEDSEYAYTIMVQDVDHDAIISIHAESIPNWLTFLDNGRGTATLTGIPENEHVGSYAILITGTDGIAEPISQAFTITVVNTNDPPVITTLSLPSADEDILYNALLTGDDMDGDTIVFTASGLPSWLTLTNHDNHTASLQGIPTNDAIGQTQPFIITVTDPDGVTENRSFSFMVNNTNDAPFFISKPKIDATEDSIYKHIIQVQDIDPDPVIYFSTVLPFPNWLTITDNHDGTAIVSGTPLNEHVGDNVVGVLASDGIALPVAYIYTIHVTNTNDPPVITSSPIQTVDEDAAYRYQITGDDMDGDPVKFIVTGLPSWLKFSDKGNSTGILEGIPTNNDVGTTESIIITAIDPDNSIATQSLKITVNNTNDAPWFVSQPNTLGIEDITYAHTVRVEDVDPGATLTILAKTKPSWLTLTDNGNGTARLTGKPLNAHVGNNTVVITVTDGLAAPVSQTFIIRVTNTNDAPVITSISNQAVFEDALYFYELHAEDVDQGDYLQFTAEKLPNWLVLKDNGDNTAVMQGIPKNNDVGVTALLKVSVMDQAGATDSQSFTILVINTNDCPEISAIESQTSLEYKTTLPFPFTVSDMDGDALTIQVSSSDPSVVAINASHITFCAQSCNGESIQLKATNAIQPISLTILPVNDGVAGITITVADAQLSASTSFILTVTNVNISPQIGNISDTIIDEDARSFPIGFTVVDADCEGRQVTVSVITDVPGLLPTKAENISIGEMGVVHHLNADIPADLNLLVSPLHNQSGVVGITVTVTDADNDSAIRHFKLTVNSLDNDPPELSLMENVSIDEDTTAYQTFFTVMDPDGGHLTIAVQSSNQMIVPNDHIISHPSILSTQAHIAESLTLTINPMADENGSVSIAVIVTDEQNHVSERSFLVTVKPVNDVPMISDIFPIAINEDTRNYQISYSIMDADGDSLRIHAISGNEQLIAQSDIDFQNLIDTEAGIQKEVNVFISTQENAFGFAQVTITVADPSGEMDRSSIDITVAPINDPPHISDIEHQYINEDQRSSPIALTISDLESGQLEIVAQTSNNTILPISCLTFAGKSKENYVTNVSAGEPENLTLIIMPPTDINGTVNVELFVYDSDKLYHSTQFPLTIIPVNDLPKFDLKSISLDCYEDTGPRSIYSWITNISTGAFNETDRLSFIVNTKNNHLFASSPRISIYKTTGTLTFKPASDAYGTALVEVSLSDGYSTTTEKTFMINILPINDAPNLTTTITARKTIENRPFERIPFTLSDIDDNRFTISVSNANQFFSDISICSETDCQHCSQTSCEFEYEQTSKDTFVASTLEILKGLTNISDEWNTDIQDIDNNTIINLSEAIYYIDQASASFFLHVYPKTWQSGNQTLTLMVQDEGGSKISHAISFSVTPVSNPPLLKVNSYEGFEDDIISVPLTVALVDTDSEELLDVLISGVPEGASLNKGIRNSGLWILSPKDLNYLLIAPAANCSDDITLTVTASSKEKSLTEKATVTKDVFVDIIPVADMPLFELESTELSGQVDQDIPIVFKHLQLTDTDGSEKWDRIEIIRFDSDLQFSMGTITNGKLILDLSHETEMDLSGLKVSVKSAKAANYSFVIRVFSKETENNDIAMRDMQVSLSLRKRDVGAVSDEGGGCFVRVLGY